MKNARINANRRNTVISSAAGRWDPVPGNDDEDETKEDADKAETGRRDDDGTLEALPSPLVTASK